MDAILSEKGQVTIPKRLRDSLGLKPGVTLNFTEEEGRLVARKWLRTTHLESGKAKDSFPQVKTSMIIWPHCATSNDDLLG